MKILMLGWELPPHNSGGLGVACYSLARALAREGADISFVMPYRMPETSVDFMKIHAVTDGINDHGTINSDGVSRVDFTTAAYSGRCMACADQMNCPHGGWEDIRGLQRQYSHYVQKLVKRDKPKVIHAHDWLTLEAGVAAKQTSGAPLIAHVHSTEFDRAASNYGNPIIHEIERHGLLMADRIVAVSHATKRILTERYQIPASKIEVIHNSAEALPEYTKTSDWNYTYLRVMQNEGYLVVATIGRLTMQKGLTFFLRAASAAASRYDKFIFVVAGDGDQRDELIALSADLGIADKVIFTGFIRGQAWRDIYALADVFVMSSVSEPFGLTALEAAQHDTAVSLTKQSGVGEILKHVLRYDYWDTDRLADQLVNLAGSDGLRRELKANVRTEFSQLSWQTIAARVMHEYRNLDKAVA